MKNIFYLLIILFSLNSISSCKTVEIKQFEKEQASIIHEVLSFYIKENPEFMEFQKANNIPSIYLSKTFRLNSSMFDIGMPMATIPSKFKGQVEISRNTFPRGTLTEYIFPNEILASQAFQNLKDFKRRNRSYWEMKVDVKCPSTMILQDNRLYHVITGGWFMIGMEKEIATVLFD